MKYFVTIEYKVNGFIGSLKVDDFESDSAENAYLTVCNIFDVRNKDVVYIHVYGSEVDSCRQDTE